MTADSQDRAADPNRPELENAIAVVGMAAHLPGARTIDGFWSNLRTGVESITRFTDEELEAAGVDSALLRDPLYVKANGVLSEMEWFDAGFFGLSPRDAAVMDPQTRHFLECVWHALEDAGHVPESFGGPIGVFAGAGAAQYFWKNVVQDPELMESVGYFLLRHTGNDKDFVATRASYEFDLTGPSLGVQTACSTSLVAVHLACQSLLGWECDLALAGGVTIEQPHITGYLYEEGEILSPDGHCRSFDHRSKGTVFGSGAGVVALRRYEDAVEDGDTIHAVIRGSAVNNDGSGKVSYLAPSVDGQARVITEALHLAGVDPASIGLVEAHGTGTQVGDPIEVAALTQAYRQQTEEQSYCALGSVKSNLGHLDTAAGVASLIKAVLAVKHGVIPPTLHFEAPNPLLQLETSPFYINPSAVSWPEALSPRIAGVSSLGVGGTNAHVIVQQAPERQPSSASRAWQVVPVSARSQPALEDACRNLVDFLEADPDASLADVAHTLQRGRRRFGQRRSIVCRTAEELIESLGTGQGVGLTNASSDAEGRSVAFLFAGGGAQYPNMARELYEAEPVFREIVDDCLQHLRTAEDIDLAPLLFCEPHEEEEAATRLERPSLALPALFTIQYAQSRLWMSWGVEPSAMIGHSMGEYTAACLAGVFSHHEGLSLVALRGQLFESLPAGGMLSVSLGEEALASYLPPELSIAALNAPEVSVAAGPVDAIETLSRRLDEDGIDNRRIRIEVAAHSAMLEPILDDFGAHLERMTFAPPERTVISNLSGKAAGAEMATPRYWVRHLRETVRFAEGLGQLLEPGGPVLVEVGPGRTLATLARMHPDWSQEQASLHSTPHPTERSDAQAFQLSTLGALWAHGVDIDWERLHAGERRVRLSMPGYPFERQPHFVAPPRATGPASDTATEAGTGRVDDPSAWYYATRWTPSLSPASASVSQSTSVLVLADPDRPGARLAERLRADGHTVRTVQRGAAYEAAPDGFVIDVASRADWEAMFTALARGDGLPRLVVHAWALGPEGEGDDENACFYGPLHLIQALEAVSPGHSCRLVAVTSGATTAPGASTVVPVRALLGGPIRVASKEIPTLQTRLVDVDWAAADGEASRERLLHRVGAEITSPSEEQVVALRGSDRLVEDFAPLSLPDADPTGVVWDGGVYLVTGGLGGIGLVLARDLAAQGKVRLVLTSRSGLPPEAERDAWLAGHDDADKTSRAIREVRALEAAGAQVLTLAADVTDSDAMHEAVGEAVSRFGRIDGVVHAAGILDDGPLLAREPAQAHAVLDPKVRGATALLEALGEMDLDFVIFFSSVSAVVGAPGQIDYAAGNAFLDALAHRHAADTGRRTLSLAWGAWKDVGMAAELAGEAHYERTGDASESGAEALDHPLFDEVVADEGGTKAFRTTFTRERHWMLEEHRVRGGSWILPGSGYVELIRAAAGLVAPDVAFTMKDLVFVLPFQVDDGGSRELEVRLEPGPAGWSVSVSGRASARDEWIEHATAAIESSDPGQNGAEPLAAVVERIGTPDRSDRPAHPVMDFGPRWANIAGVSTGQQESLLSHELPTEFTPDLDSVELHPAVLDMATGGAQHLIPNVDPATDFLVPAGYGTLVMHEQLGARSMSHVRLKNSDQEGTFASFDVTIYDPAGRLQVVVSDFTMIRVPKDALHGAGTDQPSWLRDALSPDEGREAFRRILSSAPGSHVFAVTRPVTALVAEARNAPVRTRSTGPKRAPVRGLLPDVAEVLADFEAVAEAAAIGGRADGDSARVVGFVVYHPGMHATVSELRRFVRGKLPKEFVPQNFVEMASLPREADGTVRLEDLRDPFATADDYVAPRTDTEKTVAAIWADLLALDRVGIHDNFLDVGGHSLVGIRVLLRIQQETGVRIEANALTMQTLEQLAADIDREAGAEAAS